MRLGLRLVVRLAACLGLIASAPLSAQRPNLPPSLGVPFLAQSELLCGGAAVAMVERWWGRRGVYGEEFQHLVRPTRGGILSSELAAATTARGWRAEEVAGTAALVIAALRDSTPVIAMIEVGANRFHYVVIVGWGEGRVVYHDPARSPFASHSIAEFEARWRAADHWAMLVRPALSDSVAAAPSTEPSRGAAEAGITDPLLDRGWLFFQAGRYAEAATAAEALLRRTPEDSIVWQLLASSRYLAGDASGALAAWNRIERPKVDLVTVAGAARIRFGVFTDAIAIPFGSTLTRESLALARRRIAAVPAVVASTVEYRAVEGGVVEVNAAVLERPLLGPWRPLAIRSAAGLLRRDLVLALGTPLGLGEEWRAQWRWDEAHPRVALRLELPVRLGVPGVIGVEGSREEFHFADSAIALSDEERHSTSIDFTGWLHSRTEAIVGVRFERWNGAQDYLALSAGTALHVAGDRLRVTVRGERAVPLQSHAGYSRANGQLDWRVPMTDERVVWSGRAGVDWASTAAPRARWPMAGGNLGKAVPLRAHRTVVDDALPAWRSSRAMAWGGVALDRALGSIGPLGVSVGGFLDGARLLVREVDGRPLRSYLDVGAGVRIGLPGAGGNAFRVDVARSVLSDKRWGVSAGLERAWPLRLRVMP